MARVIEASSGTVTAMYRRNAQGKLISVIPDRDEYVSPPKGTRCKLTISGISDEFPMPDFKDPEKTTPTVRVEFQIEQAAGNWGKTAKGKRFTELFPLKLSSRTNLGKLIGALRGVDIEDGEAVDIDQFIGSTFITTTRETPNGNVKIGLDAIEAGSAVNPFLGQTDEAPAPPADDEPDESADDPFGLNEF